MLEPRQKQVIEDLLLPLPVLLDPSVGHGPEAGLRAFAKAHEDWKRARAEIGPDPALDALLDELASNPTDDGALAAVRVRVSCLARSRPGFAEWLAESTPNPRQGFRVCTFNLHGIHDGSAARVPDIARRLAALVPDVVMLQEAIDGAGVRDTAALVAEGLSASTGETWTSRFAFCHLYHGRWPEGVALCSRHPMEEPRVIDLNRGLRGGLAPSMERFALASAMSSGGRSLVAVSLHLDHAPHPALRAAQAEKLVAELDRLFPAADGVVVAGDLNDLEDSPALRLLAAAGFRDAYRCRRDDEGFTFPLPDPGLRIDYVLVKGDLLTLDARTVLEDSSLSDHAGVFAHLR